VTWLDHILTTSTGRDLIEHIDVVNNFVFSDQLPLLLLLNYGCFHVMEHNECNFVPRINWSSIESPSTDAYHNKTSQLLCNITLDYDMISCNKISCNNSDNKLSTEYFYLCSIKALSDSNHNLIPVVGTKGTFQPKAEWNDYVKTAHSDGREAFLLCQSNAKLIFGPICDIMNLSRLCLEFVSIQTLFAFLRIRWRSSSSRCFSKYVSVKW